MLQEYCWREGEHNKNVYLDSDSNEWLFERLLEKFKIDWASDLADIKEINETKCAIIKTAIDAIIQEMDGLHQQHSQKKAPNTFWAKACKKFLILWYWGKCKDRLFVVVACLSSYRQVLQHWFGGARGKHLLFFRMSLAQSFGPAIDRSIDSSRRSTKIEKLPGQTTDKLVELQSHRLQVMRHLLQLALGVLSQNWKLDCRELTHPQTSPMHSWPFERVAIKEKATRCRLCSSMLSSSHWRSQRKLKNSEKFC